MKVISTLSILLALPTCTHAQGACPGKEHLLPGGAVLPEGLCAQIYLQTDQLVNLEARPRGLHVTPSNEVFVVQRAGCYECWETLTGYVTVLDDPSMVGAKVEPTILVNKTSLDHGLAVTDTHVYASNAYGVYRWPYQTGQREPFSEDEMEIVVDNIPNGTLQDQLHPTRTILVDQDNFLFLATGSVYNIDPTPARANIRRFDLTNAELPLQWADGELVAEGTRNTVGITKDKFGVLWGVDNGYDHPYREDLGGDINEDNPADEVNVFPQDMWGSFYGYPYCFTEWEIPEDVGGGGAGFQWVLGNFTYPDSPYSDEFCRDPDQVVPPALALETHSAPLSITFYEYQEEWPEECPPGVALPQEWDGDAFITYHGSYYRTNPTPAKVMRIPMTDDGQVDGPVDMEIFPVMEDPGPRDSTTTKDFHSAEWLSGVRPVDVKFDNCGRLLVSSDGSYEDQDGRMVIMVQSNPPPRNTNFPVPERPEGITEGPGSILFVSQILSGKVLAMDVLTDELVEVVPEQAGDRQAWGLVYYKDHLFVAGGGPSFGGGTVEVHVYNLETGDSVVSCAPATTNEFGSFLNDVSIVNGIAYITDSVHGMLMAMSADQAIAGNCDVWELPLPDNFAPTETDDFGANGVVGYGDGLLISHEIDGSVWYVSNLTNVAEPTFQEVIPDGGALFADGLAVDNDVLYVTQNFADAIGVFELDFDPIEDMVLGTRVGNLTSPDFATPATSAIFDGYIYSTNSRFEALGDISAPADNNVVGVALNSMMDGSPSTPVETAPPTPSPSAGTAETAQPSNPVAKGRPTSITAPPTPVALPTMPTPPSSGAGNVVSFQTEWVLTIGFGFTDRAATQAEYDGYLAATADWLTEIYTDHYDGSTPSLNELDVSIVSAEWPPHTIVLQTDLTFGEEAQAPSEADVLSVLEGANLLNYMLNYLHSAEPTFNIFWGTVKADWSEVSNSGPVPGPAPVPAPTVAATDPTAPTGAAPTPTSSSTGNVDLSDLDSVKIFMVLDYAIYSDRYSGTRMEPTDEELGGLLLATKRFLSHSLNDFFESQDNDSGYVGLLSTAWVSTDYRSGEALPYSGELVFDIGFENGSSLQPTSFYWSTIDSFDFVDYLRHYVWLGEPADSLFHFASEVEWDFINE